MISSAKLRVNSKLIEKMYLRGPKISFILLYFSMSMASRVPGLSQSSIFHESDRLDAESIEKLNRRTSGGGAAINMLEPIFRYFPDL